MTPNTVLSRLREFISDSSGQSLIEGALVVPLLVTTCLGVVELGLALQQQHVVTTLSREGANLISRDATLEDAATTLASMSGGSVDLGSNSKVIFTVLKRGATVGTANYNQLVVYERYEYGSYSASSRLRTRGTPTLGTDHVAANSDADTALQVQNAPTSLASTDGGLIYVAEFFSTRPHITPLDRFGVNVPTEMYSIAYF